MLLSDGLWLSLGWNRGRMTCCHPSMPNAMCGMYDIALFKSGLVRKDGNRVVALSELRISHS